VCMRSGFLLIVKNKPRRRERSAKSFIGRLHNECLNEHPTRGRPDHRNFEDQLEAHIARFMRPCGHAREDRKHRNAFQPF
jgi:hypothetical protein